ncbi:Fc.00g049030.m01.CDS01 [Cosmosporella sp. VM-42]
MSGPTWTRTMAYCLSLRLPGSLRQLSVFTHHPLLQTASPYAPLPSTEDFSHPNNTGYFSTVNKTPIMSGAKIMAGLVATTALISSTQAQKFPKEDLILCDCGIGDNKDHPEWSTSRQMNWYQDIKWPESAYTYPEAPDMAVQIPYNDGIYPWTPEGATGKMPNGDVWTAYIEDSTPDGFKAGSAVTTKEGGQTLSCWAYRGRPVSAAINKTANADAVCWSAFVCNREKQAPKRPGNMGTQTSSLTTASAKPTTSFFSEGPPAPAPTATDGGNGQPQPKPTEEPHTGQLFVNAALSPRFLNWQNTWESFISNFVWDQGTGRCIGGPVKGDGYTINIECAGIQIDSDSHMTLILIQALRDVGLKSLWFSQNPVIPGQNTSNTTTSGNTTSWAVIPESFSLQASDVSNKDTIGYLAYNTTYDNFLSGPCSTCDTTRFNKDFFDPIIAAMQGTYPVYNSYNIQAQCSPWMVCQ